MKKNLSDKTGVAFFQMNIFVNQNFSFWNNQGFASKKLSVSAPSGILKAVGSKKMVKRH